MGFQLTPVMDDGGLDTSGDNNGGNFGPHPVEKDMLYKMACENRDGGNKMTQNGEYEAAIGKYSELIMQLRALGNETDVEWTPEGEEAVRQLRAAAYLNLSLCFLRTQQWTHASNTATRSIQGDKEPPDPKENVLVPEKKAKALFRRAQAQAEGFKDYEKAKADLEKALEYTPEDKAVQQELRRVKLELKKSEKETDKAMAGFFGTSKRAQSGKGIFEDKLIPSDASRAEPKLTEIKKLSDGLWLAPKDESQQQPTMTGADGEIDFEELSREINEMREDKPEAYAELRDRVKGHIEEASKLAEEAPKEEASEPPAVAEEPEPQEVN